MLPDAIAGESLWAARLSGKLNGLIAGDRADREPAGDADPALRRGHEVERDRLADHPLGLLGPEPERDDRPVDLDQRVADRLAGLEGHDPAELLAAGLDPGADVPQDRAALVGGQRPGDLERRDGRLDRLLVLGLGGVERRAGGLVRVGRVRDDERIVRLDPAAGEEDRVRLGAGGGRHRENSFGVPACHPTADGPIAPDPADLRDALRVRPGTRVNLAKVDPAATHGRDEGRRGRGARGGARRG